MNQQSDTKSEYNLLNTQIPFDVSTAVEAQKNALQVISKMNQMAITGAISFNKECLQFLSKRLKEDLQTSNEFSNCQNPQDFYDAYTHFFQTALNQYMEEVGRMSQIGNQFVGQSMKIMENQVEQTPQSANKDISASSYSEERV